jgi:probable addiction module antidote protein
LKLRKFDDYLYEKLRDPEYAIVYLETALEDGGIGDFLYALRKVATAQGGVQKVAEESQRGRESLYKSLSKQGNPRIKTLDDILHALGMRIAVARVETVQTQKRQGQTAIHS